MAKLLMSIVTYQRCTFKILRLAVVVVVVSCDGVTVAHGVGFTRQSERGKVIFPPKCVTRYQRTTGGNAIVLRLSSE